MAGKKEAKTATASKGGKKGRRRGGCLTFLLAFAGLGLLALAAGPWVPVAMEQTSEAPFKSYIETHHKVLDLDTPDGDFAFPRSFYNNKFFMLGEIHGVADLQRIDLALLVHLNQRAFVRHYVAELDPAQAYAVNTYLESGDEALLDAVFDGFDARNAQWANHEFYTKIEAIRAFNGTISEHRNIEFFGVDKLHDDRFATEMLIRAIDDLPLGQRQPLLELSAQARLVLRERDRTDGAQDCRTVVAKPESAQSPLAGVCRDYFTALGQSRTQLESVRRVLPGLRQVRYMIQSIHTDQVDGTGRYPAILANLERMVFDFGIGDEEPLYGMWGLFHVFQAPVGDQEPLAMRIQGADLPFANRVVTITPVYRNSAMMAPTEELPDPLQGPGRYTEVPFAQDNPYIYYIWGIGDLARVIGDARAAILPLREEGTPYRMDQRLVSRWGLLTMLNPMPLSGTAAAYSDHVLYVNGSAATTPYGEPAPQTTRDLFPQFGPRPDTPGLRIDPDDRESDGSVPLTSIPLSAWIEGDLPFEIEL